LADYDGEICEVEFRNSAAYRDSLLHELRAEKVPAEIINGIQAIFPMLQSIKFVPGSIVRQFLVNLTDGQAFSFTNLQNVLESLSHPKLMNGKNTLPESEVNDAVCRAALIIDNTVASSGEALVEILKETSNRTTIMVGITLKAVWISQIATRW